MQDMQVPEKPENISVDAEGSPITETKAEESTSDTNSEAATQQDNEKVEKPKTDETKPSPDQKTGKFKRLLKGYWRKKKWSLPLTLLVIILAIFALPFTRYSVLGLVLERSFTFTTIDSKTNTPVSGAVITIDGNTTTTNSSGKVTIKAKVGKRVVSVTKKYYKDFSETIFVGISTTHNSSQVEMNATGRQVPITIIDKITGKPISGADIKVLGTEAKTDSRGKATIVLPTSSATQSLSITANNYNNLSVIAKVTSEVVSANTFAITPVGHVYFLSNLSGSIDVVSTNLDGTDRTKVVAGTGKEDPNNTILLASRDWKYLALLSRRDTSQTPKLYLITTSTNKLTTIDQSVNTNFTPIGWSNHHLIYQANNSDISNWQSGSQVINSYDTDTGKTIVLDKNLAEGTTDNDDAWQNFSTTNIVADKLVYAKVWYTAPNSYNRLTGKQAQIMSINTDGTNQTDLKDFALSSAGYIYIYANVYTPQVIYFQVVNNSNTTYYEYSNGNVTQTNTITSADFTKVYPTYLVSPSDSQTFWSESRDGKNTLFVGAANGNNGQQLATLSDYSQYGWYTDSYLLVSKGGSELYIMPASGGNALKISDYYKVVNSYNGYGYGYGGL